MDGGGGGGGELEVPAGQVTPPAPPGMAPAGTGGPETGPAADACCQKADVGGDGEGGMPFESYLAQLAGSV